MDDCKPFIRNNRDRFRDNEKKMDGIYGIDGIDDKEINFMMDFLDSIHVYFIHSYSIGFRVDENDIVQIQNSNESDKKKNDDELDLDFTDIELSKLSSYLKPKRQKLYEIRGIKETKQLTV